MIYLDLDDFHESNTQMEKLVELRCQIPDFRVTLFTIPGLCSRHFIADWKQHDWLDLVPHGWAHTTTTECRNWDREQCEIYLDTIEPLGLTHGFKAPGWQISDAMYAALLARDYWLADQPYNRARRPAGLRVYELDAPNKIHGHIGHMGGHNANEIELILPQILVHRNEEFGFVRDAVA